MVGEGAAANGLCAEAVKLLEEAGGVADAAEEEVGSVHQRVQFMKLIVPETRQDVRCPIDRGAGVVATKLRLDVARIALAARDQDCIGARET